MNIISVYPADFKKCWELSLVSLIFFVNYYDVEARCVFFTNASVLIKITSTSQTALSSSHHFSGRTSHTLFLCNKYFDQKIPNALALAAFFIVRSDNSIFIPVTWLTADACHVNSSKHGSNVYIVGSCITFP